MASSRSTVGMVGLGYIGLPTAAVMASRGLHVIGVDVNQHAVDVINDGRIHIVEPDLEALVHEVVRKGQLRATTVPEPADVFLIAVPTPFKADKVPDLSYIEAAAKAIALVLKKGNLVVLESTSPVGTTERLVQWLAAEREDLTFPGLTADEPDISVAYCPERVLPGKVIVELVENDRVVGGMTPQCADRAQRFYKTFVKGDCIITNARTAELCKLTENSFRDVNIAFANELSLVADELNIDVWELVRLANRHPRVNILQPGPGVGGHCIAVDPWFIVHSAPSSARMIKMAREINDGKPEHIVKKIHAAIANIEAPVIACLGLAFKPDIGDLRESPAMEITETLARSDRGVVLVVEPHIEQLPATLRDLPRVHLTSLSDALMRADVVVLLVHHQPFFAVESTDLEGKFVIDTRGIWQ
ncbi:MAG: UDP-N-acetyl-D-mannosamine dehydrogenase [Candidimonas sp.]|nr:UDP-N-acetyl-D-mannosamine dehydrogenase [Candidimonas sp.]